MLLLKAPVIVVEGLKMVSSWTPTIALLFLFGKLVPAQSRWSFIRRQFSVRVDIRTLLMSIVPLTTVLIGTIATVSIVRGESVSDLVIISPLTLVLMAIYHLPFGPVGEELGWHGFLLPHLRQKHSFLKATL